MQEKSFFFLEGSPDNYKWLWVRVSRVPSGPGCEGVAVLVFDKDVLSNLYEMGGGWNQ
jgi:hypothetical protein